MDVQLQDVAYSGAEGTVVSVCIEAGATNRPFNVTLSTSSSTASAG